MVDVDSDCPPPESSSVKNWGLNIRGPGCSAFLRFLLALSIESVK